MLASVDIFVAPNLGKESFGIVLLEAMAAGTPVLASNIEAFRRVLDDGRAGVLVPVGDAAALAAAAGELLDDATRRAALRDAAAELVAHYDWAEIARRVVQVYETVAVDGLGVRAVVAPPPGRAPHPSRAAVRQ
jgi:phosphatidylinositol alpha-mannosyltransferase